MGCWRDCLKVRSTSQSENNGPASYLLAIREAGFAERDLFVSARPSSLSLSWQGTGSAPAEESSSFAWFSRYAGSLILTIAGSIVSTLAGYVIRELPKRLNSAPDATAKAELGPQ